MLRLFNYIGPKHYSALFLYRSRRSPVLPNASPHHPVAPLPARHICLCPSSHFFQPDASERPARPLFQCFQQASSRTFRSFQPDSAELLDDLSRAFFRTPKRFQQNCQEPAARFLAAFSRTKQLLVAAWLSKAFSMTSKRFHLQSKTPQRFQQDNSKLPALELGAYSKARAVSKVIHAELPAGFARAFSGTPQSKEQYFSELLARLFRASSRPTQNFSRTSLRFRRATDSIRQDYAAFQ